MRTNMHQLIKLIKSPTLLRMLIAISILSKTTVCDINWSPIAVVDCGNFKCFGILINKQWILTSASCLQFDECVEVHLRLKSQITYKISRIFLHPNFEVLPDTIQDSFPVNDIGLIRLTDEVDNSTEYFKIWIVNDKIPSTDLKCMYPILKEHEIQEHVANNFLKCDDIKQLYFSPDIASNKVNDICEKIAVSATYGTDDLTKDGGPLLCLDQLFGLHSSTIAHDFQKKTAWTLVYAYHAWVEDTVINNDYDSRTGTNTGVTVHCNFLAWLQPLIYILFL